LPHGVTSQSHPPKQLAFGPELIAVPRCEAGKLEGIYDFASLDVRWNLLHKQPGSVEPFTVRSAADHEALGLQAGAAPHRDAAEENGLPILTERLLARIETGILEISSIGDNVADTLTVAAFRSVMLCLP
jgi:hypothetical protein